MNELEEKFHKAFGSRGGLLDYKHHTKNSLLNQYLFAIRDFVGNVYSEINNAPPLYIDVIDNTSLNACATKVDNTYLIGINYGTILVLRDLFMRMLANPNVLINYGNPDEEILHNKVYNIQLTEYVDISNILGIGHSITPISQFRGELASNLTLSSTLFLAMHELAHVVNGHVDYVSTSHSINIIEENYAGKFANPLVSQTLEMDADCFGIVINVRRILSILKSDIPEFAKPLYKSFKDSIHLFSFSVYSLWRLFGMGEYNDEILDTYNYPPPGLRQFMSLSTISTMFLVDGKPNEEISNALNRAILDVETAFDAISEYQGTQRPIVFALTSNSQKHVDIVRRNWNNVRPLLEPFTLTKLAPYCSD